MYKFSVALKYGDRSITVGQGGSLVAVVRDIVAYAQLLNVKRVLKIYS